MSFVSTSKTKDTMSDEKCAYSDWVENDGSGANVVFTLETEDVQGAVNKAVGTRAVVEDEAVKSKVVAVLPSSRTRMATSG
ncbi:hypothetical protein KSS87_009247 [Heliosperma pusillum]|nr:hypothetical protein KSS87_009247 [Heliosperma pusillum]